MNTTKMTYVEIEKRSYYYGVNNFSNTKILMIGKFLEDCFDFNEAIALLKNHPEIYEFEGNEAIAKIKGEMVTLGIWYDANNPEYEFTLPKETFINILQDWIEIKKQDPQLITLYWDDGAYRFEIKE